MTAHSSAFGVYFRDNLDSQLDELTDRVDVTRESFATEGYEERRAAVKRALLVIAEGIANHHPPRLRPTLRPRESAGREAAFQ